MRERETGRERGEIDRGGERESKTMTITMRNVLFHLRCNNIYSTGDYY